MVGDLQERFEAHPSRWWYRRQVLRAILVTERGDGRARHESRSIRDSPARFAFDCLTRFEHLREVHGVAVEQDRHHNANRLTILQRRSGNLT